MVRAHRHYHPGEIWHLTHRCQERQFLLKFACDRHAWLGWLFEAKKRFGLSILDYMVTSNHIHLLTYDKEGEPVIAPSMHLVAGASAQQYNRRKGRQGGYWEDRYHATAVESGEHFRRCLSYLDLNMVRAGVVSHPDQWPDCGYVELQQPKRRYGLMDFERVMELLGVSCLAHLQQACREQVEVRLTQRELAREACWSESLAVGSELYIKAVEKQLGPRAKGRLIESGPAGFHLKETSAAYRPLF